MASILPHSATDNAGNVENRCHHWILLCDRDRKTDKQLCRCAKCVKLRKTYQNTEGQNGKFPLNIISAIDVFKMISYLKYCLFVIRGCGKTFLYMHLKGEKE